MSSSLYERNMATSPTPKPGSRPGHSWLGARQRWAKRWLSGLGVVCLSACLLSCGSDVDDTSATNGGSVVITASAEALGLEGYPFPPRAGSEAFFADGWEVKFSKILVVVSNVTLSSGPDSSPSDPSRVGSAVARLPGPFAVNLAAAGDVVGKGGGAERAWTLGRISEQNLNAGKAFDASQRYAVGYALAPASDAVTDLRGLDESDSDWQEMKRNGWTHLLIGSATFKGSSCQSSDPDYDFSRLPSQVQIYFGFDAGVSMQNCQNPENTGAAMDGEEFQRGVQLKSGSEVTLQVTLHTDHLFWNTVQHGAIASFDALAAQAEELPAPAASGTYQVTLDALSRSQLAPVTDRASQPLPWRSCVDASEYTLPSSPSAVTFDTRGNDAIATLRDFVSYNAKTMGHLNQDGLCYVKP